MVIIHTQCQEKHSKATVQFSIVKPLALAAELKEENSIKNNSELFLTQLLGWNVSYPLARTHSWQASWKVLCPVKTEARAASGVISSSPRTRHLCGFRQHAGGTRSRLPSLGSQQNLHEGISAGASHHRYFRLGDPLSILMWGKKFDVSHCAIYNPRHIPHDVSISPTPTCAVGFPFPAVHGYSP